MTQILIVEDEEKIARFVTLELEHEGYQVEHAADGRTAVDLALERDYDLILLDVLLPQLNGMEVLRRVRKHKDVPVIMGSTIFISAMFMLIMLVVDLIYAVLDPRVGAQY